MRASSRLVAKNAAISLVLVMASCNEPAPLVLLPLPPGIAIVARTDRDSPRPGVLPAMERTSTALRDASTRAARWAASEVNAAPLEEQPDAQSLDAPFDARPAELEPRPIDAEREAPPVAQPGDATSDATSDEQSVEAAGCVDPNQASMEELESLPRIGPALAARIIDGRPYRRADDLVRVSGIGPSTLARMRDRVCVH